MDLSDAEDVDMIGWKLPPVTDFNLEKDKKYQPLLRL